jgi:Ulp1 family protease
MFPCKANQPQGNDGYDRQYHSFKRRAENHQFDFGFGKVIVVFNVLQKHWSCITAFIPEKVIVQYDSSGVSTPANIVILHRMLCDLYWEQEKAALSGPWIAVTEPKGIPKQGNTYDCGAYSCMYADCISRDCPFTFSPSDIPRIRKKMGLCVLHQSLSE